jgi:hypothetical protein
MTSAATVGRASGVPYYCQWESPELVSQFCDGSMRPAEDPAWAASGAATPEEYGFWSTRSCGLACLKMILSRRGQLVPPTMRLVEQALSWQAFVRDGERVAGLIYRPFADWVGHDYEIAVDVAPDLTIEALASAAAPDTPVIASVHSSIRWPDCAPPQRGGHLVLVTGATDGVLRLHNPSGIQGASQRDALIGCADFERFFAGRGILIRT